MLDAYWALLTLDKSGDPASDPTNAYEKLKCALVDIGWEWRATSAFMYKGDDIGAVWRGMDLVARQASGIGGIGSLALQVVRDKHGEAKEPSSRKNHPYAVEDIEGQPDPW